MNNLKEITMKYSGKNAAVAAWADGKEIKVGSECPGAVYYLGKNNETCLDIEGEEPVFWSNGLPYWYDRRKGNKVESALYAVRVMRAVASLLELPTDGKHFHLANGGTMHMEFCNGSDSGKWSISAHVSHALSQHRPCNGEGYSTHIKVSMDKMPKQIAADIQRRLLPEYARLLAGCENNLAKFNEYYADKTAKLRSVADPLGVVVQFKQNGSGPTVEPLPFTYGKQNTILVAVDTCGGGAVRMVIDTMNTTIAGKIAEFLATL
jgi:hypothetical protein